MSPFYIPARENALLLQCHPLQLQWPPVFYIPVLYSRSCFMSRASRPGSQARRQETGKTEKNTPRRSLFAFSKKRRKFLLHKKIGNQVKNLIPCFPGETVLFRLPVAWLFRACLRSFCDTSNQQNVTSESLSPSTCLLLLRRVFLETVSQYHFFLYSLLL